MKAGAVEFLTKPFDDEDLLRAVQEAVEHDRRTRQQHAETRELRERYGSLTAREQEVMRQVISGLLNKQIAGRLGIVEKTVKVHRARAVAKLGTRSTADLVRLIQSVSSDAMSAAVPASAHSAQGSI